MGSIDQVMEEEGRKWTWLADRLGVRPKVLWLWRTGQEPWPGDKAREAAQALRRPMDELFTDSDNSDG